MRVLIGIALLLTLPLMLLVGVWVALDSGLLRETVNEQLSAVLGQPVRIADIDMSFGKQFTIRLKGLEVDAADWAARPQLATVADARVTVVPSALLQRPIVVERVSLENVQIHLEDRVDGSPNWHIAGLGDASEDESTIESIEAANERPHIPVFARSLSVEKLSVSYSDGTGKPPLRFTLEMTQTATDSQLTNRAQGLINDTPYSLSLNANPMAGLINLAAVEMELELNVGEVTLDGTVAVKDMINPTQPRLSMNVRGPSLEYLTDRLGLQRLSSGPLDVNLSVQPNENIMAVDINGEIGEFHVVSLGQFDSLQDLTSGKLKVALSGPDLSQVGRLLGEARVPEVPFSLAGAVVREQQTLTVNNLRFIAGELQVDARGVIPDIAIPAQADFTAQANTKDLAQLASLFELATPIAGAGQLDISMTRGSSETDVSANLATRYGTINIDGIVRGDASLSGTTLTASASGDSASVLMQLFSDRPIASEPWSVEFDAAVDEDNIKLSRSILRLGNDQVTATGSVGKSDPYERGVLMVKSRVDNLKARLRGMVDAQQLIHIPAESLVASSRIVLDPTRISANDGVISVAGIESRFDANIPKARLGTPGKTPKTEDAKPPIAVNFKLTSEQPQRWLPASLLPERLNRSALEEPFATAGHVDIDDSKVALTLDELTWGNSTLSGTLSSQLNGHRQQEVNISFNSDDLLVYIDDDSVHQQFKAFPINGAIDLVLDHQLLDVRNLRIAMIDESFAAAKGRIDLGDDFDATAFDVNASITDLAKLEGIIGFSLPPQSLAFEGRISGDGQRITADRFIIKSGESRIRGELDIRNPEFPRINLALQSDQIDLRPFLADPATAQATPPVAPPTRSEQKKQRLIPDVPIDLSPLGTFEGQLTVNVDRLISYKRQIKDIALAAQVENGGLTISSLSLSDESGGTARLRGKAMPEGISNRISLALSGSDINIGIPAATPEQVARLPRYDINTVIFGTGANLRELLGNANGYNLITSGPGQMRKLSGGFLSNDFIAELIEVVNPFRKTQPYTEISCITVSGSIKDGVLAGDPVGVVASKKLNVIVKSRIDLKTEKISATLNTIPQEGLGLSASELLHPFIGISGTLAAPSLALDPQGTLIQGGLAFATGGMSLLGKSLADRFLTTGDPCQKTVDAGKENRELMDAEFANFH